MSKPTWDDTEEIVDDIPSWDDTQEVEESSQLGAAARGAGQGLTFGLLDEIAATFGTKGASPSQVVADPKEAIETEKQLAKDYEENLQEQRQIDERLQEDFPTTSFVSELAGGIIPGIATGGASAAGSVLRTGGKEGLKQAAKSGLAQGTAAGFGYSEGETPEEVIKDTLLGGGAGATLGATLPIAGKGIKEVTKKSGNALNALLEMLPESSAVKTAYKYGKQGKKLTTENVDADLIEEAKSLISDIQGKKSKNSLKDIKNKLDKLGVKVDTKETLEEATKDIEGIAKDDILGIQNKELLPKLRELLGENPEQLKMLEKADKNAIKKMIESQGRSQQAIIKGEKDLAKQAMKSGDSLETISNVRKSMDDLEIPTDTSSGEFSGVSGRFKAQDGSEYTKDILKDSTAFQPEISSILGPDGRPIVKTLDAGSGKISAMVGNIQDKVQKDLSNMSVSEVESLRKQLNVVSDLAKMQGSANDPIIGRARKLATDLKQLTDDAVEKVGDSDLVDRRKTFSDIYSAEEMLGIDKRLAPRGDVDLDKKVAKIGSKLGFDKGFKERTEIDSAKRLLGDDVFTPERSEKFDFIRDLNETLGRDSSESATKAGIYRKLATNIPNVAGRAANKVENLTSPVTKTISKISNLSTDQINKASQRMLASENKGIQNFGETLSKATQQEGPAQAQTLWALSQNPAFRKLVEDTLKESDREILGNDEPSFEETESEVTRDPSSIQEREGKADMIKETSEYTGLEGTPNTRVKGSDSEYGLYYDSLGKLTSGIGDLITSEEEAQEKMNVSKEQAESNFENNKQSNVEMMKNDLVKSGVEYDKLPQEVKEAIEEASFQLGSFSKFPSLKKALSEGNYEDAAIQAMTTKGEGSKASNWIKQTPVRVKDFIEKLDPSDDVKRIFNEMNTKDEYDFKDIDETIDNINTLQGSGDLTPVNELDDLLGKIASLGLDEESTQQIEDKAVNMQSFGEGLDLKELIRRLS